MFEQMKGLTPAKKVEYYFQYYGVITAVVIAVIIFAIYTIVSVTRAKDDVASIIVLNNYGFDTGSDNEELDAYFDEILNKYEFDTKEQEISVETSVYIGEQADSQTNYASTMKLQTVIMANSVDIVFFDDSYKADMLSYGAFCDITQFLTEEQIAALEGDFLYYQDEETGETYPVAFKVSHNSKLMQMSGWYDDSMDAYVGVCYRRLTDEDAVYQTIIGDCVEE